MFNRSRFFSSQSRPFLKGFYYPDAVSIDLSGTRLDFLCPPHSPCVEVRPAIFEERVDLQDRSHDKPPAENFFNMEGDYASRTIFFRELGLWGGMAGKKCVGELSLSVRVLYVPGRFQADSLFDYDYFSSAFPRIVDPDLLSSGKISQYAGGLMNGSVLSYTGLQGKWDENPNHLYGRSYITVGCEHLLVFDYLKARPSHVGDGVFTALDELSQEVIFSSIVVTLSPEADALRRDASRRNAERNGGVYDEETGNVWIELETLDLPDESEGLFG